MTASTQIPAAAAQRESLIEAYRDDGPLARALGAAVGERVPLPAVALVLAGAAPLLTMLALEGADAPRLGVAMGVVWLVVVGSLSQGREHSGRFTWAVPALLRLVEYAGLLWFAAIAGSAVAGAFALLAVLSFRHYDIVYRMRYQGAAPAPWVGVVAAGWEGRLLVGFALLALDALPAGFFVVAALLAVLFVAESAAGWTRYERARRPALYDDEGEDEE